MLLKAHSDLRNSYVLMQRGSPFFTHAKNTGNQKSLYPIAFHADHLSEPKGNMLLYYFDQSEYRVPLRD